MRAQRGVSKMKCSSMIIALVLVCTVPPGLFSAGDTPSLDGGRSDPEIEPIDNHNFTASWDFADPGAYCATTVDVAPGKVNISMTETAGSEKWSQLASIGAGGQRDDFSAAYDDVNDQVIIHGGRYFTLGMQDTDWYRPLRTYDPASNTWTDRGESKLPAGNVGVWDGPDGAFLTHGGYYTYFDINQGINVYVVNQSTFAWLPATQSWSQRADGPQLYHHAAVYDPQDGLMITMGGMDTLQLYNTTRDYYYNNLYTYNYTNDQWDQRNASGSVPPARAYHSAVWDNESGQMIIFGGYNGQGALSDCWAYNYTQNWWTQLASAAVARYMHVATWNTQKSLMTVVAGKTGALNSNETLLFDPSDNTWTSAAKLTASARVLAGAAFDTTRRRTVVCGGGTGTGSDQFQDAWAFSQGDPVPVYIPGGSIQSAVLDLGPAFHSIDRVSWAGDMPVGTGVSLRFRAHNLNVNSSGFTEMANASKPTQQGRYLQWNLTLQSSTDRALSPELWEVKVEYSLNNKPVANASGPAQAFKRTVVQLNGIGTDADGDSLRYIWTKLSGPAVTLSTPDMPTASFSPEYSGVYVFTLVVRDALADSPASTVTVTVENRRPRAEAGPDQSGVKGELLTLNGNGIDEDRDPLTYEWTQTGGPNVTLVQPDLRNLTFLPAKLGNYTFRLVVDDGELSSAPAVVNATITGQAPAAELLVVPVTTWLNESVNFSAGGSSDPDGKLVAYDYDFGDGTRTGWTPSATANHSYARPGVFNATVLAKDDDGFISEASPVVRVTVKNRLPVIGATVTPETGNTSTQFRFLVPKGETYDPDGTIVDYFWDFGDGNTTTSNTAVHTFKQKGSYEVLFRVTDNWGGVAEQFINITVVNRPPVVAAAAPAQTLSLSTGLEQPFMVDASDPDNDALTYTWTVNGAQQTESRDRFFFKPDKPGTYHIKLTISDGETTSSHEWDVTAKKKAAVTGETGFWQYALPILAIVIIVLVVSGGVVVATRKRRPKEGPVVVYAPPGYKPGDDLVASSGLLGEPQAPAQAAAPPVAYAPPPEYALSPAYAPSPATAPVDASEPVATVVANAPSESGPAPMEAIPYAEPIAPSAGSQAMEAAPITDEDTAQAAPAPSRPPASYQPPPKSGLSPREPYAEQMWKR